MVTIDLATSMSGAIANLPAVWAYLDPGAGSMMLQVLLATVLSSAFFMKTWFRQVRESLLIRNKKV